MLRLTTTAPSPLVVNDKSEGDGDGSGTEDEGEGEVEVPRRDLTNTNNSDSQGGANPLNGDTLASGGNGLFRNGFLRTFGGLGRERAADVENQNQNSISGV